MNSKKPYGHKFRIIHRYLGFFLAGIMAVYSLSGIILIFRDTDLFKVEKHITKTIEPNANIEDLGKLLEIKRFKVEGTDGELVTFQNGTYNSITGVADYTVKEMPYILDKMTHMHKSRSADPLFYLNIFFGLSLLFFVISAFWMFMPKTSVFKKGLYFSIGGIILTLLILFI
ncbi:hypothetical protein [Marinigracilibium pacificum]|uniref:PepSY domain-containing protein n=1 Tax=Marinigracilibium pacificum TaxID=2729599 RepID=A0A848J014_9BACT|nr:hypothetical protein [Marinigracilibium pacificum]NMM47890.1 PepSY domain-containing protein [Marinigracilibium pacificum]